MSHHVSSPPLSTAPPSTTLPYHHITHKSHRLRTSPVPGEGSTFVPVVKFSSQFTQRNALRGTKPVYGTAHVDQVPLEADIVSLGRAGGGVLGAGGGIRGDARAHAYDARTHGWTISITSTSSLTEEVVQVEVQERFEAGQMQEQQQQREGRAQRRWTPLMPPETGDDVEGRGVVPQVLPPLQGLGGGLLGGAESQIPSRPSTQPPHPNPQPQQQQQHQHQQHPQPLYPRPHLVPAIPTLSHDRVLLTSDDLSRIRIKCLAALILGTFFPPLWVLMGWGHSLDKFLLPLDYQTDQLQLMMQTYTPYRRAAGVLAAVAMVGTVVGIVVGALALGGVV